MFLVYRGESREIESSPYAFQTRVELETYCREHPTDADGRLEAWDTWQRNADADEEAAGLPALRRRERLLEAWWLRALHRRDAALAELMSFPTFDPTAIRFKISRLDPDKLSESETEHVPVAWFGNSLLTALGFEEAL